jgi:hypothetical protein
MRKLYTLILLFFCTYNLSAQIAKTQVVRLSCIVNTNGTITLTWPKENYTGVFKVYKRIDANMQDWGIAIATVPGNENTFTDASFKLGDAFEYMVVKSLGSANDAIGYVYAGNKYEAPLKKKGIILLIDRNMEVPLSNELLQLRKDLTGEGYEITNVFVERTQSSAEVKELVKIALNTFLPKPEVLLIIGHVPVPYSGFYSRNGDAPPPDGHIEGSGDHTGAWPADVFYAIHETDAFSDLYVTCTTGAQARHHNIAGDGKWDQTKLPFAPQLEVGRIDLYNMNSFGKSDTVLLKNYLNRNHLWRTAQWKVTERALIDNNFGSLNLASTGYANFAALVKADSVFDNRDYFTAQKRGSYLWSYGCGAGSYTSCNGIGNTANFVNDSFENVFTILAGSFFGDWDITNNFLRAPLASKSLASFWGGIPKWYMHHMGLGERIGKGVKISQSNTDFYFSGNFNSSQNSMHIALMGDPTLRQHNLPQVTQLVAVSANKKVQLNWTSAGVGALYAVYKYDTTNKVFNRVNNQLLSDTFYTDEQNYFSGNYQYAVCAADYVSTPSGSYLNRGSGAFAQVNHVNALVQEKPLDVALEVYPNPIAAGSGLNLNLNTTIKAHILAEWYNLNGSLVKSQEVKDNNLETPQVPQGCYLLKLKMDDQVITKKILIY